MIVILLVIVAVVLIGVVLLFVVRGNSPAGRGQSDVAAARDVSDRSGATERRGPGLN